MNIPHSFYSKTKQQQRFFIFKIICLALLCFFISIVIAYATTLYFFPFIILPVIISIIAPFIDVPSLKATKKITYYAPLFIAEKEKNKRIKIHGGTLLDYCFTINKNSNARERTRFILYNYIEGLLKLVEELETNSKTQYIIQGTSYIINERTANKIGLKRTKQDGIQLLILLFNYPLLTLTYSITKTKLSFPNYRTVATYEGKVSDILAHKKSLLLLRDKLS